MTLDKENNCLQSTEVVLRLRSGSVVVVVESYLRVMENSGKKIPGSHSFMLGKIT